MGSWGASADFDWPFIGLRAFRYGDRKYFFGRDDELDVLELQVQHKRFVAVVGRSGCGKSSLISAGLRPRLARFQDRPWNWIEMHPADAPVRNLALALADLTGESGGLLPAWADRFERVLTRSSSGIAEALALLPALQETGGSRVLLFVDHFEELLRFANLESERSLDPATLAERRDEATAFIRLLLAATKSPDVPIHVVVTMRSDFIGDCARFNGLPEAVSRSQFLVPDMTRDQREDVIRKAIRLAGGRIDPGLVQRALNDTNDDPDQLPSLQYNMMRCWERALDRVKQEGIVRPISRLTITADPRRTGIISRPDRALGGSRKRIGGTVLPHCLVRAAGEALPASVPISKFAPLCGTLACEFRNPTGGDLFSQLSWPRVAGQASSEVGVRQYLTRLAGESSFRLWDDVMNSYLKFAGSEWPFIGLRPFQYGDHECFFGRDEELNVLQPQVTERHFVAIVGGSGSGKSSLISAGLRPRLAKVQEGPWNWIEMHPADAPLRKLALALADLTGESGGLLQAWADRFERVLTRSSSGIAEALALIPRQPEGSRVLLLVDQFEELFRIREPWI